MRPTAPPLHVVPDAPGHGVVRIAGQLATAVGAEALDLASVMALPRTHVHAHVTDRLYGASAHDAELALMALARRHLVTATLHDVPQPGDGVVFERRASAYRSLLRESEGWVVSSQHEEQLVRRHLEPGPRCAVIALPVIPLPDVAPPALAPGSTPQVAVLGWVYPGKGHAEVIRACAGTGATVRALGAVSPGHEALLDQLVALARDHGVRFEASGWVSDGDLTEQLRSADVPVAAHRNVSASGSINSWIAAGRRPLVLSGSYAEEMARLRPRTITLVDDAHLGREIAASLADPARTHLEAGVSTSPHLADCATAYLDFWRRL